MRDVFSDIPCKNPVKLLEVKLTNVSGYSYGWVPLEFELLDLSTPSP